MKRESRYVMIMTALALLTTYANSIAQVEKVERKKGDAVVVKTGQGKPKSGREAMIGGKVVTEGTFKFLGAKFGIGKVVKGAPYSATATTETIQKLSDGNQIVRKNESKTYRDREGRTRIDQTLATIGKWTAAEGARQRTYINDPVAGFSYEVDPRNGATHKIRVSVGKRVALEGAQLEQDRVKLKANLDRQKARIEADLERQKARVESNLRRKAKPNATPEENARLQADLQEQNARLQASLEEQKARLQATLDQRQARLYEERKRLLSAAEQKEIEAREGMAREPGVSADGRRKTQSLGKQSFEGVEAEGTRTTLTIPAGEIGNTLPIEVIDESWYSPELQVLVMTSHLDPRTGETTYRLTNINRGEPDRSLFQVPGGIEIKQQRKSGKPTRESDFKKKPEEL